MLRRLMNFFLLSQGVSAVGEREDPDRFEQMRAKREAWEREQREREAAEDAEVDAILRRSPAPASDSDQPRPSGSGHRRER
ncbi:MAG: hypothetical protein AAGD00_01210 [Planctomycetota bacterium]